MPLWEGWRKILINKCILVPQSTCPTWWITLDNINAIASSYTIYMQRIQVWVTHPLASPGPNPASFAEKGLANLVEDLVAPINIIIVIRMHWLCFCRIVSWEDCLLALCTLDTLEFCTKSKLYWTQALLHAYYALPPNSGKCELYRRLPPPNSVANSISLEVDHGSHFSNVCYLLKMYKDFPGDGHKCLVFLLRWLYLGGGGG